MAEEKKAAYSKRQKDLIYRALTDAAFRKRLEAEPQRALHLKTFGGTQTKEIERVLVLVRDIEARISALSDELLCANGGPCGIAKA